VSWFHNLQHALDHGYRVYVAGWTDPEIKRRLGARFTATMHAVRVRNPVLRGALELSKRWFESDRRWTAKDFSVSAHLLPHRMSAWALERYRRWVPADVAAARS